MRGKLPHDCLSQVAQENIDACYDYFGKNEPEEWGTKVCYSQRGKTSQEGTTNNEKLLNVLSCIDLYFGSEIIKKDDTTTTGIEIVQKATSQLPSFILSGTSFYIQILQ